MTVVASANILSALAPRVAATALRQVIAESPDLIGVQEWYLPRLPALRRWGDVRLAPGFGMPAVPLPAAHHVREPAYHWVATLADGNVVGARADRFDLVEARAVLNVGAARCDRPGQFLGVEPPRSIAVGIFRDRQLDRTVALLCYHLTSGVQQRGQYRDDRPRLAARHRREVHSLRELVTEQQRAGHVVFAVGDSNFDGLRLPGLTSAWQDRRSEPGTLGDGSRKVDDVHGPRPVTDVRRVVTASDHQAVVVTVPD